MVRLGTCLAIAILWSNLALAEQKSADIHIRDEPSRYYLIFAARGGSQSLTGHAFIIWFEVKPNGVGKYVGFGLYPKKNGDLFDSVFGPVPGEVVDDVARGSLKDTTDMLSIRVDSTDFKKAQDIRDNWASQGSYHLGTHDCITLVQAVAHGLGLPIPLRENSTLLPQAYLRAMIAKYRPIESLRLPDGSSYRGQIFDGNPDGEGEMTYSSGDRYKGQFKNGKREGQGTYYFNNGVIHFGTFKNDKPNGSGVRTFQNGEKFEGMYVNGVRNGTGTFHNSDGTTVTTEFTNDVARENNQKWTFPDGISFTGKFDRPTRTGQGTWTSPDGTTYTGRIVNGSIDPGKWVFPDGSRFEGQFSPVERSGSGDWVFSTGAKYSGSFRGGIPNGHGTYFFPDGDHIDAEFAAGLPNGHGLYTFHTGEKWEGDYVRGAMEPTGAVYFDKSGNRYDFPDNHSGRFDGGENGQRPTPTTKPDVLQLGPGTFKQTLPDGREFRGTIP